MQRSETNLSKIKWQCRRGQKELDQLFNRYLEQISCDPKKLDLFSQLLELEDQALFSILIARTIKIPDEHSYIVKDLLEY